MNDLFKIFNPDWWMSDNNNALQMADAILFLLFLIPVVYLLIYSLASLMKYKNPYPETQKHHKFLVLFSVYRKGAEVIESVNHFLNTQDYPREKYDIVVAATRLSEGDLAKLLKMPVNVVVPDKEQCTKVYAIQQVVKRYSPQEYDMIVIFDSDNRVVPNALRLLNNAYYSGCDSIQAHRMTENLTTSTAVLSAAGEEINNNIFRKGHTKLGFSSALLGSGMAFDFEMFHRIAPKLEGSDITKAMEIRLLEENIYTEYMQEIICYSKKQENTEGYARERSRWLVAQYNSTIWALVRLPLAFLQGKWDYCNKLVQWLLPSRFLLIFCIAVAAATFTTLDWTLSFKWYALLAAIAVTFLMALPEGEIHKRFNHAVWALPILIFTALFSHIGRLFKRKKKRS